ncbi:MAG: GTPase HflX [Roseiflexaceae bacterium]|nr:GTPase HflX [Chloroflexaceae bacterium]MCE2851813.1 GTPase HflX [Chloroflexaceae bacterium]
MSNIQKEVTYGYIETTRGTKLHATKPPRDKAFLVGTELSGGRSTWPAADSLAELAMLVDTADIDVVGQLSQRLKQPFSQYYIGPGKVEEIAAQKESLGFDLVIFDDELTPGQTRNLEETLKVRVLDRTTIILDIFARHARTREGRIQVELAQYKHLLPRLRKQWTHLERQAGGGGGSAGGVVGLRGPGETQLEVDRRLVSKRISVLEEHIKEIHTQREVYRERRRNAGVQVVAIVGYTNAGKSTLLNAVANASVRAEDRLFATLDPTTRQVSTPGGTRYLLTDTVGFIQKLPTELIVAFRATLEEIADADLLLHVLDITHPNAEQQMQTVIDTLKQLDVHQKPMLTVLNKIDKLAGVDESAVAGMADALGLPSDYVAVSAQHQWGLDILATRIEQMLKHEMRELRAYIPYRRADLLQLWRQRGVVSHEEYDGDGVIVEGRLPDELVHIMRSATRQ